MGEPDISAYEGLIFSTAARYDAILDDDIDDIRQVMRVKVWQVLARYENARSAMTEEDYVFGCLRNLVKDLLKSQSRRNKRRGGGRLFIDDLLDTSGNPADRDRFEARYLCAPAETVYACVEEEPAPLPATLSEVERAVVILLLLDFNQREIGEQLGISRKRVQTAHCAVREKMRDWRPGSGPVVDYEPTAVAA